MNELLDPDAPAEVAVERAAEITEPSAALIELASGSGGERMMALVQQLAEAEPECVESKIRDAWLLLVLAWLYEHRDESPDPLQRVEEVHADFGYPEQIANFVRYMPMEGPDLGSSEANERRLFERWKRFVEQTEDQKKPNGNPT